MSQGRKFLLPQSRCCHGWPPKKSPSAFWLRPWQKRLWMKHGRLISPFALCSLEEIDSIGGLENCFPVRCLTTMARPKTPLSPPSAWLTDLLGEATALRLDARLPTRRSTSSIASCGQCPSEWQESCTSAEWVWLEAILIARS